MKTKKQDWKPKEDFQKDGTTVSAWITSDTFNDTVATLTFWEDSGNWHWSDAEPCRAEIVGVIPTPLLPEND